MTGELRFDQAHGKRAFARLSRKLQKATPSYVKIGRRFGLIGSA